ncbi:MAG: glycosyltransferase family 2 protein [Clostridia bacterium]|nr:glycosyltransferase family 2 protein [Clostridia bacterium]
MFSIIVPIYNTEKYLAECVESVLAQTYPNFELILVDDGSKDKSGTICDEYAKKDERIKVIHKENSGQIATRACGLKIATGEYIVFVDSDDIISLNALERIKEKFQEHHCDMVVFDWCKFSKAQEAQFVLKPQSEDLCINTDKELYKTLLDGDKYNSVCRKVVKRKFLCDSDYKHVSAVRYGEDLLQSLDIIQQKPKTVVIDDVLYGYRVNPYSVTHKVDIERFVEDRLFVRKEVYERILQEQLYDEEDWTWHRTNEIVIITEIAATIALQKNKYKQKKVLFKKIKNSDYWKKVIISGSYKKNNMNLLSRIKWFLFKNNFYFLLFFLVRLKHI